MLVISPVLVYSWGVWDEKSLFAHSSIAKDIYKKMPDKDHTEISFRDQLKPEPHPRWFPSGNFKFEFSDELPRHVYMGVPPGLNTTTTIDNNNHNKFIQDSRTQLYGHPLNTDTSLLRTVFPGGQFSLSKGKALTFFLDSTRFNLASVRTTDTYFLPSQLGILIESQPR